MPNEVWTQINTKIANSPKCELEGLLQRMAGIHNGSELPTTLRPYYIVNQFNFVSNSQKNNLF